jgi:sister-chromatid-cohesion protein PDS5
MEADEDMEGQEEQAESAQGVAQLQFNQPLTWKAGRAIALTELLKRLEALSRELQSYEQDDVERESLFTVAKELASQQLLGHKDRGVKAFTACCVVDIFRLCAPDAPYTAVQMKVSLHPSRI